MRKLNPNTGIFMILAGVVALCLHGLDIVPLLANKLLVFALLLTVAGFFVFIFISKRK
jgi:hypothetical protein